MLIMKLCRSHDDRRIAGVCGGLAKNLGLNSGRLRIVWVLATIFTAFAGVVVYLALWFLIPKETPPAPTFDPPPLQPWKKSV
jgi:phage shock protein PspC (stress-responsive transcriptional regulator)